VKTDEFVYVWDTKAERIVDKRFEGIVRGDSPDGRHVFISDGTSRTVKILSVRKLNLEKTISYRGVADYVPPENIQVTPDRRYFLFTKADTLYVFEYATWKFLFKCSFGKTISNLLVDEKSNLAVNTESAGICLFDLNQRKATRTIPNNLAISSMGLSRNERLLIALGPEKVIRVWQLPSGAPVANIMSSSHIVTWAVSDDNQLLATVEEGNYVTVYEISSGRALARVVRETPVGSLSFAPNRKWLISRGPSGASVFLWQPKGILEVAMNYVVRNFSVDEWEKFLVGEAYRKTNMMLPIYRKSE